MNLDPPYRKHFGTGMKIIFLDVDGVLHPVDCPATEYFQPVCMERLRRIVAAAGEGALIILSSSWRVGGEGRALVDAQLTNVGLPRVAGVTPEGCGNRGGENVAWLDENPGVFTHFVVLDDIDLTTHHRLKDNAVATRASFGLRDKDVARAMRILM